MTYGRALNGRVYEPEYKFLGGATYTGTTWVSERIFQHIYTANRYRIHLYAAGGRGGSRPNSQAYGAGGGSRGNIGIHDIDLAVGDSIYVKDDGRYLYAYFYHGPSNVEANRFLTLRVGVGKGGGNSTVTSVGSGAKAPVTNPDTFNVLSFNAGPGNGGSRSRGGDASKFTGDLSIATYTSDGQNGPVPSDHPILGAPWILGLGCQGAPYDGSTANYPWQYNYGGVVLEEA